MLTSDRCWSSFEHTVAECLLNIVLLPNTLLLVIVRTYYLTLPLVRVVCVCVWCVCVCVVWCVCCVVCVCVCVKSALSVIRSIVFSGKAVTGGLPLTSRLVRRATSPVTMSALTTTLPRHRSEWTTDLPLVLSLSLSQFLSVSVAYLSLSLPEIIVMVCWT